MALDDPKLVAATTLMFQLHYIDGRSFQQVAMHLNDNHVLSANGLEWHTDTVAKIREICEPLDHKVYAVVNYDGFDVDREFEDAYLDAVQDIGDRYFHGVTRFTTSAFMRAKLGHALESRGVAPHIYESEEEATGAVRDTLPRQG